MKITNILSVLILSFLAIQFVSCEKDDDSTSGFDLPISDGEFRAKINGSTFLASETEAVLDSAKLVLAGTKANGEEIRIIVANPTEGTFPLSEANTTATYQDGGGTLPYVSIEGEITIDVLNPEDSLVSGKFNFKAVRFLLNDNGMPVMGDDGMPQTEDINVTDGGFQLTNLVEVTGGNNGGIGGDPIEPEPEHEFMARIDGTNFNPHRVLLSETTVGGVSMFKIEAFSLREMIRIDVPRNLGLGTHEMVNMSDGTKLIGIYRALNGVGLSSNLGELTITQVNLEEGFLTATFKFTANDPLDRTNDEVNITNGTFTIYFEGVHGGNNILSAKVDGVDYNPNAVVLEKDVVNQYPVVRMKTNVDDQELTIQFPETIRVGTYTMTNEVQVGNEVMGIYTPIVNTTISYYSLEGTFTVTELDRQTGIVEGTFEFTATDRTGQDETVYEITDGTFNIILP